VRSASAPNASAASSSPSGKRRRVLQGTNTQGSWTGLSVELVQKHLNKWGSASGNQNVGKNAQGNGRNDLTRTPRTNS